MSCNESSFDAFLNSSDTLWIWKERTVIFRSAEKGIAPLIDYLKGQEEPLPAVAVFDRIVGNAAALLLDKARCTELYAPIGSDLAAETLKTRGIHYTFSRLVPFIINRNGDGMCPFEQASLKRSSDEFFTYALNALAD